jgi:hypothetical protein
MVRDLLLRKKMADARCDVLPDGPGDFNLPVFGVGDGPVGPLNAGNVGAIFATAHGDEHFGPRGEFRRELLREAMREIDSDLSHDLNDYRVNLRGGPRSGRKSTRFTRIGEVVEKGRGDLRSTGVVNASKDESAHPSFPSAWQIYAQQFGPQHDLFCGFSA